MLLVLTNRQDPHADAVIRALTKRDVLLFRLNSEDINTRYCFELNIDETGNWSGQVIDEVGRSLNLTETKVAWLRKPSFDFVPTSQLPEMQSFVSSETRALVDTLYSLPNIIWINDPFAANKAKVKFQQLALAKDLGIRVPKTLVTNQPEKAMSFFDECGGVVLAKAVYSANVKVRGLTQSIPSQLIEGSSFKDICQTISLCPTQLQEYVQKSHEVRVTVVGQKVVSVRIDSQLHDETKIDWRVYAHLNPHSLAETPLRVEEFCREFLRRQGLRFGAMDFIVTPDGEYVFLENNPFGQYLWLETETGAPLTEIVSDYIQSLL
jgi:glutathione synthase/RimK-type ligase-like ATP-grasp enzyme